MKRYQFAILLGIMAAALAIPASAQFYAGAGVGRGQATGGDGSTVVLGVPVTVTGGNSTRTDWDLYGGYQFTKNWGIEGQYTNLGNRTFNVNIGAPINLNGSAKIKASEWGLAGTGKLPLSNEFYVMGKLGASRNHIGGGNVTLGGISVNTASNNRTGLLAGGGAGYDFTKNIGIRLEYDNFGKFCKTCGFNNGSMNYSDWSLRLQYTF
jgi:OmpA-OmpF porin, OOP family